MASFLHTAPIKELPLQEQFFARDEKITVKPYMCHRIPIFRKFLLKYDLSIGRKAV